MISVLVCDDNAVVRGGLKALLSTVDDIRVVGEASNGHHAIEEARRLTPDVVLLDVQMPVMDGVTAAVTLAEMLPVLMLTYSDGSEVVDRAIRAGASGYLVHGEFEPDELAQAIRDVHLGGAAISRGPAASLLEAVRTTPASNQAEVFDLTRRQRQVMELLVAGQSNQAIAENLVLSYKTVKNHVNAIFGKLGAESRSESIAIWLGLDEVE